MPSVGIVSVLDVPHDGHVMVDCAGLRPPPGRRSRPDSPPIFCANSFSPRPIVLAAIPVIRETVAMPPYPALLASVAAKSRRPRSSRCGDNETLTDGVRMLIHTRYAINPRLDSVRARFACRPLSGHELVDGAAQRLGPVVKTATEVRQA